MGLEALVTGLPAPASVVETYSIDVTDLFGQVNGEDTIFHFRKPATGDMFALEGLVKKIQFQFPDFPDPLAENIALMARCFVEEKLDANKAWLLFANLVKRTEDEPQKFLTFKARLMLLFPAAFNLAQAEQDVKKNDGNAVSADVSVPDAPATAAGGTRPVARKRGTTRRV